MVVDIEIYRDRMIFTVDGIQKTISSETPFSTTRLLVGTFHQAVDCLKKGLNELGVIGILKPKPTLNIVARELCDGGLSEVEKRCLLEVGHAAGAKSVNVE